MNYPSYECSAFGIDQPEVATLSDCNIDNQTLLALGFFKGLHRQVVQTDKSLIAGTEGRHRASKSVTVTTEGFLMDDTFWDEYKHRVVVEPKEFMDCIDRIMGKNIHGAFIQVDEAGVGMAASEFYEIWARTLAKTVQMCGWLNPMIFFIAPIKELVNPTLRKLMQMNFSIKRYNKEYNQITPYELEYSGMRSKWYYKKPIINIAGERRQITRIKMYKPPQFIIDKYDELAGLRKPLLFKQLYEDIKRGEIKEVKETRDINKLIEDVIAHKEEYLSQRSKPGYPILNQISIRYKYGLAAQESIYVKEEAQKKIRAQEEAQKEAVL